MQRIFISHTLSSPTTIYSRCNIFLVLAHSPSIVGICNSMMFMFAYDSHINVRITTGIFVLCRFVFHNEYNFSCWFLLHCYATDTLHWWSTFDFRLPKYWHKKFDWHLTCSHFFPYINVDLNTLVKRLDTLNYSSIYLMLDEMSNSRHDIGNNCDLSHQLSAAYRKHIVFWPCPQMKVSRYSTNTHTIVIVGTNCSSFHGNRSRIN